MSKCAEPDCGQEAEEGYTVCSRHVSLNAQRDFERREAGMPTDERDVWQRARVALAMFCKGQQRMCIPVQPDDDDVVIAAAIDAGERLAAARATTVAELEAAKQRAEQAELTRDAVAADRDGWMQDVVALKERAERAERECHELRAQRASLRRQVYTHRQAYCEATHGVAWETCDNEGCRHIRERYERGAE